MFKPPTPRFIEDEIIDRSSFKWRISDIDDKTSILVDELNVPLVHSSKLLSFRPGSELYSIVNHDNKLIRIKLSYGKYQDTNLSDMLEKYPVRGLSFEEYQFPITDIVHTQDSGWTVGDMFWKQFNIESIKGYNQISENKLELFTHLAEGNVWTMYTLVMHDTKLLKVIDEFNKSDIPSKIVIDDLFLEKYLPLGG